MKFPRLSVSVLVSLAAFASVSAAAHAAPCDRACLIQFADDYFAALVRHDPSVLPLAAGYKFTENTATLPLGEGLWVGASEAPASFKIYATDPASGQVAFMGVMKEFNKAILVALRLKIVNGKITEIEHIVARPYGPGYSLDVKPHYNLATPRAAFAETVPPAERLPREQMQRIASSYFDSIEQTNGKVAPFADDCERHENGGQTTTWKTPDSAASPAVNAINALGCAAQIDTGELSYITRIRPRRLIVIDEEKGLVFGFPIFVHKGAVRSVKITGVPGVTSDPKEFGPIDLIAAEVFKIHGGKIHEIEAIGTLVPRGTASGWEWPQNEPHP